MRSVLDQPTLILNKNWSPIGVEPVRDSLAKISKENAKIVDPRDYQTYTWDDWKLLKPLENEHFILTVNGKARVPDIIVLSTYDKVHSRTLIFNRRNLFARDGNSCQYCGKHMSSQNCTIDHVVPQCQGGLSTWDNCVIACVSCNVRKGGRTPKQAQMKLLKIPVKPKWSPVFKTRFIKHSWGNFINLEELMSEAYWQAELEK